MSGAAQRAGSEPETLSTERVLLTSTQEDGGERRDSRGGKLRGRLAVEEALPQAGQRRGCGGRGLPRRGGAPGQGRYLRVVGVGIVVSPGSLQREHTGGPRFVHEAGPRAAPPAGGAWCFLCWGPGWPGTKGSEGLL